MKHCCQPRFTPGETERKVRDALRIVDSTYRKALKVQSSLFRLYLQDLFYDYPPLTKASIHGPPAALPIIGHKILLLISEQLIGGDSITGLSRAL